MKFLENDLESILYSSPQDALSERGLECFYFDEIHRQFHLGGYGIADLVTFKHIPIGRRRRRIEIMVYELKQEKIEESTFFQGLRYMRGLSELIEQFRCKHVEFDFSLILIGKTVNLSGNVCFLPDFFDAIKIYTYNYEFDGIRFEEVTDYKLKSNTFSEQTINRARNLGRDLVRHSKARRSGTNTYHPDPENTDDLPF